MSTKRLLNAYFLIALILCSHMISIQAVKIREKEKEHTRNEADDAKNAMDKTGEVLTILGDISSAISNEGTTNLLRALNSLSKIASALSALGPAFAAASFILGFFSGDDPTMQKLKEIENKVDQLSEDSKTYYQSLRNNINYKGVADRIDEYMNKLEVTVKAHRDFLRSKLEKRENSSTYQQVFYEKCSGLAENLQIVLKAIAGQNFSMNLMEAFYMHHQGSIFSLKNFAKVYALLLTQAVSIYKAYRYLRLGEKLNTDFNDLHAAAINNIKAYIKRAENEKYQNANQWFSSKLHTGDWRVPNCSSHCRVNAVYHEVLKNYPGLAYLFIVTADGTWGRKEWNRNVGSTTWDNSKLIIFSS